MTHSAGIPEHAVANFQRDGFVVLSGFYDLTADILPIQFSIYKLVGQVMKRHGLPDKRARFSATSFDDGYQQLIRMDRALGGEVYDAVKQIPAFLRLLADQRNEALFQLLRPGSIPGIAAGGSGIRIDNPSEDRFRAAWHQEYPSQLRSLDGVVFWSPLRPVTLDLGPVQFCPGSHKEGLVRVYSEEGKGDKSGAYALRLEQESALLARFPKLAPLTVPGDLVAIDFLTLHASGVNRSDVARWSLQFRYFNFDEPTGMRHGWAGSYAAGTDFRRIHPELCAEKVGHEQD